MDSLWPCRRREAVDRCSRAHDRRAAIVTARLRGMMAAVVSVMALAAVVGAAPALAAEGDANQSSCPSSTESSPGFRSYLPDCRAYELVTKLNKGGLSVEYGWANCATCPPRISNLYFASADGRHVMFGLEGGPEAQSGEPGETYVAARTAGGWEATELSPPEGVEHPGICVICGDAGAAVFSDVIGGDFTRPVFQVWGAAESKPSESSQNLYEGGPGGSLTLLSKGSLAPNGTDTGGAWYAGQSADGSHILFFSQAILEPQASGLVPERCCVFELYDRSGGQTHVVGLLQDGSLETHGVVLGGGGGESGGAGGGPYHGGQLWSVDHAISSDGSRIFFENRGYFENGVNHPKQVYVRENDTVTKEISLSQKTGEVGTPSNGAFFLWASADGSKVLFGSGSQLTNDATAGGGMYEYDFESHALRFLTPDATDVNGARVPDQAVVGASDDGSRIYFVAEGKLEGPGLAGKGTTGQPNLYVYEPRTSAGVANPEPLRFIATLSASDLTETQQNGIVPNVRVTPDGRYIAFASQAKLTSYENGGHAEIYRYDAEATTKPLICVSCDPSSEPPVADASLNRLPFGPPTYLQVSSSVFSPIRNISEDGSVFFETAEPLLPQDVNGKVNVYEWREGHIYLISDGTGPENAHIYDVSANGSDVFFTTYDKLAPQDGDGAIDVYDARIGGGFPAPSPPSSPCAGSEECKGAASGAAVLGTPMSAAFSGAGNETPPATKPASTARKLARALRACRGKPKKRRARCRRQARKRYGAAAERSSKGGK
jgi:WD40-like Beta Propeller Repeat